jgi:YfiH family protein
MTSNRDAGRLSRVAVAGLVVFTDVHLAAEAGIVVAFSTRIGGVSRAPYAGLDLAGHTGDDPASVDENRSLLLTALGLDPARLITADQVHGATIAEVEEADAGRGARISGGRVPVPAADAMLTVDVGLPLMMMYADCVPVVLVAPDEPRAVAVVHAGWRGAVAGLPRLAAAAFARRAGASPDRLLAYIGPHIGPCHYEVSEDVASAFAEQFAEEAHPVAIMADPSRVDLGGAVRASLRDAGLDPRRIASLDMCTAEHVDLFYSYRAEGLTGRHGAVAAIG